MLLDKVRTLTVKEQDPITWDEGARRDPIKADNFEQSDSQGFISPETIVSTSSAEDVLTLLPPVIFLSFFFFGL